MSRSDSGGKDRPSAGEGGGGVTPEIAAEAAAWISSLHGPSRNRDMEDGFLAWQKLSPAHRDAFEKMTDIWQAVQGTQAAEAYRKGEEREGKRKRDARILAWRWVGAGALGMAAMAGVVLFQQWLDRDVYVSSIGEQRSVLLQDGSRMLLNTASRVRVEFRPSQRVVNVEAGEALFEVAKDASRPFVARVAGSEVVAVGTVFSVRFRDGTQRGRAVTVTLVEGRVNVRPKGEGVGGGLGASQVVSLKSGDRLTLQYDQRPKSPLVESKVDRPNMERAMAWQRHEAVFDATPLADAVAEFNRYSRKKIVLSEGIQQTNYLLSGIYRIGDSAAFANAVAIMYGLKVHETGGRLEIQEIR